MKYLSSVLLVSMLCSLALADVPVACLRKNYHDQIWNFHVSQDPQTLNLFQEKEVCTHQMPNRVQVLDSNHKWSFAQEDVWQVMIRSDFTAEAAFCKNGNLTNCEKSMQGHWLNYYDQAIHVELENNLRFTANFRYEIRQNITKNALTEFKKIDTMLKKLDKAGIPSKYQFDSNCNETMIGFVHNLTDVGQMDAHKISCFYAEKDQKQIYENQVAPIKLNQADGSAIEQDSQEIHLLQTNSETDSKLKLTEAAHKKQPRGDKKAGNLFLKHVPSDETDLYISHVNDNQHLYTWTANTCMLQTHHKDYDKEKCEGGEELLQISDAVLGNGDEESAKIDIKVEGGKEQKGEEAPKTAGNKKTVTKAQKKSESSGQKKFGEDHEDWHKAVQTTQSWAQKYKNIDELPDTLIPESYDLRNINGYDFTGPVRDQVSCGSCFTMAFIQAIESRLKYKFASMGEKAAEPLSPQFVLMCNYMAEGCEGGLAIFDGYLAEYGHLTTEKCAPYLANTKGDSCSNYAKCPAYAKISKSYYVRGYNYNPTVADIQKEILLNGPLVTEFGANDDFSFYEKGVMVQNEKPPEVQSNAQKTEPLNVPSQGDVEFVQTNHLDNDDQVLKALENQNQPQGLTQMQSKLRMANQPLNHSVFLVGWGFDEKSKLPYWIVRNSYGDSWGMRGDFFVRRGNDDFGIESELSGFDVNLL